MIGRLRGTLVAREGAHVVIDCGGVGYEVTCSGYTLGALPALDEEVTLRVFTHTNANEGKTTLYGFLTAPERTLFDLLITVKNVGPSLAMGILSSGLDPRGIVEMIAREDSSGLSRIKGVGKKTTEMLIVELREKCNLQLMTWNAGGDIRAVAASAGSRKARHPMLDEVLSALVGMGWKPVQAEAAVAELVAGPGITLEMLLRQALRAMPR